MPAYWRNIKYVLQIDLKQKNDLLMKDQLGTGLAGQNISGKEQSPKSLCRGSKVSIKAPDSLSWSLSNQKELLLENKTMLLL